MAENKQKNNQGYSAGVVVGRVLSLPVKAAVGIGKVTFKVAGKVLTTAIGFSLDTQKQYNNMDNKSVEEIGDIISGERYSSVAEKTAAIKYAMDAKKRVDGQK